LPQHEGHTQYTCREYFREYKQIVTVVPHARSFGDCKFRRHGIEVASRIGFRRWSPVFYAMSAFFDQGETRRCIGSPSRTSDDDLAQG